MRYYHLLMRVRTVASALVFCTTLSTAAFAAESAAVATIDTPIAELLKNAQARSILEKHLPGLIKALEEDLEILRFMGTSSLRELSIDDAHVVGFDEEKLEAIRLELLPDQY